MSKHPKADTLDFEFQPIELDDLKKILPRPKWSIYQDIKDQILEKLSKLPPAESFLLVPPKGHKLPVNLAKSFMNSVNSTLREQKITWHIVWSEKAGAFALAPYKRKGSKNWERPPAVPEIHIDRGIPENGKSGFAETPEARLAKLVKLTQKTFGVSLKQVMDNKMKNHKRPDPVFTDIRRAMLYVGRNGLGLKLATIGGLLGQSSAVSTVLCQEAQVRPSAKEKVQQLSQALNNGG